MIPVKDHKNLYRDEKSGAIINTDTGGFNRYKKMKRFKDNQKDEIDKIKEDISEIKELTETIFKKKLYYYKCLKLIQKLKVKKEEKLLGTTIFTIENFYEKPEEVFNLLFNRGNTFWKMDEKPTTNGVHFEDRRTQEYNYSLKKFMNS